MATIFQADVQGMQYSNSGRSTTGNESSGEDGGFSLKTFGAPHYLRAFFRCNNFYIRKQKVKHKNIT